MSQIFKKEITATQIVDYIKCDKCGIETQFSLAIDNWCIINEENFCRECQKEHKVNCCESNF